MLDHLPNELIIHIFELVSPVFAYSPSRASDYLKLLRNCCLVSKRLCMIAQPMLPLVYEIGQMGGKEELELEARWSTKGYRGEQECLLCEFLTESVGRCARSAVVRSLVLAGGDAGASLSEDRDLERIFGMCVDLEELVMVDVGLVEFSWLAPSRLVLASSKAVRHEYLHATAISQPTSESGNFVLPSLVELSMRSVFYEEQVDSEDKRHFPSASSTPNLSALAIRDVDLSAKWLLQLAERLSPLVDVLVLDYNDLADGTVDELPWEFSEPKTTVVECVLGRWGIPLPGNICDICPTVRISILPYKLRDDDDDDDDGEDEEEEDDSSVGDYEQDLQDLEDLTLQLKSVELDDSSLLLLLPRASLGHAGGVDMSWHFQPYLNVLAETAKDLNIEVIYEDEPDDGAHSSLVSTAFWRRSVELREEESSGEQ